MRKRLQPVLSAWVLITVMPWVASAQLDQAPRQQVPPGEPQQAPPVPREAPPAAREAAAPAAAAQPQMPPNEEPQLVAKVNGDGITEAEFQNNVQSTIQAQRQAADPQRPPPSPQVVHQQVLEALIESRLVEQHLREHVDVASGEIDNVLAGFEQQLQAQQLTMDAFLAELGQSEQDLRKRVEGSLAWQKFQERQLAPEKLQAYYQQNRQQFGERSFEEVEPMLPQLYVQDLWNGIVARMRPDAEIQVFRDQQPAAPETPQAPPIAP